MTGTRWMEAVYRPVSLFSLRTAQATSSGGKTLLVPTPYAVGMALVDAGYRIGGETAAKALFRMAATQRILLRPPEEAVVTNTFVKILKESRKDGRSDTPDQGPYGSSIAFREFCFFRGELRVALSVGDLAPKNVALLEDALWYVQYFGKRGSFFQPVDVRVVEELQEGYCVPADELSGDPNLFMTVQVLDEIGEGKNLDDLFDRLNSYSKSRAQLGKHRRLREYRLPYRLVQSSHHYSWYRRLV
ncbi:MAG TPA: hypothetical protein GX517_13665 [Alicyclobacillus sp.]|nr:hypothetical protein [Alicyclobacillus sp.]